jgi:outer membrane protein
MKRSLLSCAALAALALSQFALPAHAAGPWTARLRATYLDMANKSDAFSALGLNFGADSVRINSKWIPEFDFSYAFSENLSAEHLGPTSLFRIYSSGESRVVERSS